MNTLNIGFLGTGWIAGTYAKALAKLPDVKITALCNHHVEKAQKFSAEHTGGAAKAYGDFDQMLANEKLDALFVCLIPGAHTGQAEAAAAKGIHLMLEKPIALTQQRAESIAAAVRKAGVQCQIGHHMRHTAPSIKLKQMLADGSAGRPLQMTGRFFVNGLFPTWWRDPQRGGGQLVEQSIHVYDLARYFLGEADVVVGFKDKLSHERFADYQVDDVSAATVRFRNRAIASLCASNVADPTGGSVTFSVACEKVMAEFTSPNEATFVHHGGRVGDEIKDRASVVREEMKTEGPSAYDELTRNFLSAIRGTEKTRSSITDGVESLRLVLAVADSSDHDGRPVRL
jgi:predicted dehydrogenase